MDDLLQLRQLKTERPIATLSGVSSVTAEKLSNSLQIV